MDFAESLAELEITIGDSASVTFTPEEKTRALQKAWNDGDVVETVLDKTTVWATNTWSYAIPTTLTTVRDIYTASSTTADDPISSDLYEVVGNQIVFRQGATKYFNPGDAVYVKGNYKLDYATDTLDTKALQEFVIALAGYNTLSLLGYKKANLFLKNDTTMSELISLRREFERDVSRLRSSLDTAFESA